MPSLTEATILISPEETHLWQTLIAQIVLTVERKLFLTIEMQKKLHYSPSLWNNPYFHAWWRTEPVKETLMHVVTPYIIKHEITPKLSFAINYRDDTDAQSNAVRSFFLGGQYSPEQQQIVVYIPPQLDLKVWDPSESAFYSRERVTAKLRELLFHELVHHHQFIRRSLGIFQQTGQFPSHRPAFGPQARQFSSVQNSLLRRKQKEQSQVLSVFHRPALSLARKGAPFDVTQYLRDTTRSRKDVERQRGTILPPRVPNYTYYLAQPEELMGWAQGIGQLFLEWKTDPEHFHYRHLLIHNMLTIREHLEKHQPKAWHLFLRHLWTFLLSNGWTSEEIHHALRSFDLIF